MGRKDDLFANFDIFRGHIDGYSKERERINNNDLMTEKAKEAAIQALNDKYAPVIDHMRDDSLSIIEAAKNSYAAAFQAGTISMLSDQGYQTGLANILNMLEKKAISAAYFPQIVSAYQTDRAALEAMRAIIEEYPEDMKADYVIPGENRKESEMLLDMAAADVTEWISMKSLQAGTRNNMQHALNTKYIYDQLNDDLIKDA